MQYKITFLPNGEQEGTPIERSEWNTHGKEWFQAEYSPLPAYGFPEERVYEDWEVEEEHEWKFGNQWLQCANSYEFYENIGHETQKVIKYKEPSEKKEEKDLIDRQELIDFAVWYSGMSEEKVARAYQRYLTSSTTNQSNKKHFKLNIWKH